MTNNGVTEHYEALLADVYAWSTSGVGDPFANADAWLTTTGLDGASTVLDLGAGFGAHSVAFARRGKSVTAVDTSAVLLAQLSAHAAREGLEIRTHQAELVAFLRQSKETKWDTVLCLGDTLTHLPDRAAVSSLLVAGATALTKGGRLVLSYRDSTGFAATGTARFLMVRRDASRAMHCFLEVIDQDHLRVTDMVTEITGEGPVTRFSDYTKLRLSQAWVKQAAADAGLTVTLEHEQRGMLTLVFEARQR
jgi:2-polyprenyl-3-methyl-5-hydroxy-6-metoxy-1,4-benzoquinol methylase